MEGAQAPLTLGSVLQPVISDADNVEVFLMQSASVVLEGAVDGVSESLTITPGSLDAFNITADGELYNA